MNPSPEDTRLFIFEGPDESGKTTLSRGVRDCLTQRGVPCDRFAFPGQRKGSLGKLVYELHHDPKRFGIDAMNPASLQLLHVASHIDIIHDSVLPALRKGHTVLLDRFWWSTLVYGRIAGADETVLQRMAELEQLVLGVTPSAVFLLNRPYEHSGTDTLGQRTQDEYAKLASQEAGRYPIEFMENTGRIDEMVYTILRFIRGSEGVDTK